jgi:hypothetical protein
MKLIIFSFLLSLSFHLGCKNAEETQISKICVPDFGISLEEDLININKLEGELKENYKVFINEIVEENKYKIELEKNADLEYAVSGLRDYQILLQNFIKDYPIDLTCYDSEKNIVVAKNNAVNIFLRTVSKNYKKFTSSFLN